MRISREKLAYIVDSTAAPVACIALISTWIGYEVGLINDSISLLNLENQSGYGIFLNSIKFSFYPILAMFFVYLISITRKDFGPMYKFEKNAKNSLSIHIGNTSTVIEALESNVSVIHLVCDPIFDLFSSKFWPTIKVSEISTNVYKYSIKKLGKFLIFNKKSNSFNKIHK